MSYAMIVPSTPRSLLDLAPEIRVRIYGALFGSETAVVEVELEGLAFDKDPQDRESFIRPCHRSAQLIRTCKKVLQEALPVLLEGTVFSVSRFASPVILPYQRHDPIMKGHYLRHLEVDIAIQDLYRILLFDLCREPCLQYVQSLRITCTSRSWHSVRAFRIAINWNGEELESYRDTYTEVRKLVVDTWLEVRFTYLDDESVKDEMIEFRLWKDKGSQISVRSIQMLRSSADVILWRRATVLD